MPVIEKQSERLERMTEKEWLDMALLGGDASERKYHNGWLRWIIARGRLGTVWRVSSKFPAVLSSYPDLFIFFYLHIFFCDS